jgi:hypothetical protein
MKKLHLSIALALIALFSFASLAPTPVYGRSTTDKPAATAQAPAGAKPVALTDDTVIKYLEASVMILKTDNLQQGWMGSGTVLYQDMDWAYVLTCAHLFDDANQKECGIRFFYKNGAKL